MPRKKQIPRTNRALGMTPLEFFRNLFSLWVLVCATLRAKSVFQ
jgi:hypothetical protein